jgi:hypothetical protein
MVTALQENKNRPLVFETSSIGIFYWPPFFLKNRPLVLERLYTLYLYFISLWIDGVLICSTSNQDLFFIHNLTSINKSFQCHF